MSKNNSRNHSLARPVLKRKRHSPIASVEQRDSEVRNPTYSAPTNNVSILETMLQILDDGPQPMRRFRPAEKVDNSVNKFEKENKGRYEAGHGSRDPVEQVHEHNAAFPRMFDELRRRRSIANPAAFEDAGANINLNTSKRSSIQLKCRGDPKRAIKPDIKSKITKAKATVRKLPSKFYMNANRDYRCLNCRRSTAKKKLSVPMVSIMAPKKINAAKKNGTPLKIKNSVESDIRTNPDSSCHSYISCHSDFSFGNEPMVD